MTFLSRLIWSLLSAGFLTACATSRLPGSGGTPLPAPYQPLSQSWETAFELRARFNLRFIPPPSENAPPRQYTGRLEWRHDNEKDDLLFLNPLGQGVASLRWSEKDQAELQFADGSRRKVRNMDQFMEDILGIPWQLTPDDLLSWILARPGTGALVERDGQNRPLKVRELGWLIFYRYDRPHDIDSRLPSHLEASLDNVLKLNLVLESLSPL